MAINMMDATESPPPNVDRGLSLLAEEVSLTSVALATTCVRISIRLYKKQARWDDLAITAAMIFRLISFSFTMVSIAEGNGRHEYYLSDWQIDNILKWTWANEVLIFTTTCIVKISICLHIMRIKKNGWLRWILYAMIVGLVITNGACVIILFAQCTPLKAYWIKGIGHCWDPNIYNDFIYVSVGYSILSDLMCTAMPTIILWNVRITRKQKIGICGLMFLGLVASGCAAVRAYLSSLADGTDLTYSLVTTDSWGFAEANVGIIGANLALGQMMYIFIKQRINAHEHRLFNRPSLATLKKVWSNGSGSTVCDKDESHHTKSTTDDSNDLTAQTSNRTTYDSTNTNSSVPSRGSVFSRFWGANPNTAPGTILCTVDVMVAGVPYNELQHQGPAPVGAPPSWRDDLMVPATPGRVVSG